MGNVCDVCKSLLVHLQRLGDSAPTAATFIHHPSWDDLEKAARARCPLCMRWVDGIQTGSKFDLEVPRKDRILVVYFHYLNCAGFIARATNRNHTASQNVGPHYHLVPVKPELDRLSRSLPRPAASTGSQESIQLAKFWLDNCLQRHGTCNIDKKIWWHPTRLVHVGSFDRSAGNTKASVRLVDRDHGMPSRVSYLTLSHCWGKSTNKTTLKTSNIDRFRREIPLSSHEKTFIDAIEITRQLGFEYIWIDSLCIIQDSREDWQHESFQMAQVYRFSSCNISALSAHDDLAGCFFERDVDSVLPMRVQFSKFGHSNIIFSSGRESPLTRKPLAPDGLWGKFDLQRTNEWQGSVELAPLRYRAWVVQERIIAPRILHFSAKQLLWECNEMTANECCPHGIDKVGIIGDALEKRAIASIASRIDYLGSFMIPPPPPDVVQQALLAWGHIVEHYSRCSLTKPEDKLVAISAVAKLVQPIFKSQYLAGHWEYDFVQQLAWSIPKASRRVQAYRCPSWSWAAVDGHVMRLREIFINTTRKSIPLATLLSAKINHVTGDDTGEVKGGHVVLEGHLVDINISLVNKASEGASEDECRWEAHVDGTRSMMRFHEDFEMDRHKFPAKYYCLPLEVALYGGAQMNLKMNLGSDGSIFHRCIYFHSIVLESVDKENGTFKRIGYLGTGSKYGVNFEDFKGDPLVRLVGTASMDSSDLCDFTKSATIREKIKII